MEEGGTLHEDHILRSIEFPPQYHQAGMGILSYFQTVLRDKYPDTEPAVTIEQRGTTVTMNIETPEGKRELIERTLEEFVLVVQGEVSPQQFLPEQDQRDRLETQLDIMMVHLRAAERSLRSRDREIERQDRQIEGLRTLLGKFAEQPLIVQQNASPTTVIENSPTFNIELEPLQQDLARLLEAARPAAKETDQLRAVADLSEAADAAAANDTTKVNEKLKEAAKSGGKWLWDLANKVGVPLIVEALK